jgi:hypothetical protein
MHVRIEIKCVCRVFDDKQSYLNSEAGIGLDLVLDDIQLVSGVAAQALTAPFFGLRRRRHAHSLCYHNGSQNTMDRARRQLSRISVHG